MALCDSSCITTLSPSQKRRARLRRTAILKSKRDSEALSGWVYGFNAYVPLVSANSDLSSNLLLDEGWHTYSQQTDRLLSALCGDGSAQQFAPRRILRMEGPVEKLTTPCTPSSDVRKINSSIGVVGGGICLGDKNPSSELLGPYNSHIMLACPASYWKKLYTNFGDVFAGYTSDADKESSASDELGLDRFSIAMLAATQSLATISADSIAECISAIQKLPDEACSDDQRPWVAKLLVEGMNLKSVAALLSDGHITSRDALLSVFRAANIDRASNADRASDFSSSVSTRSKTIDRVRTLSDGAVTSEATHVKSQEWFDEQKGRWWHEGVVICYFCGCADCEDLPTKSCESRRREVLLIVDEKSRPRRQRRKK